MRLKNYTHEITRASKDVSAGCRWLIPVRIQGVKMSSKTFEMAIRYNTRTTRMELERVFYRWVYFHLRSKIFSGSLGGRGSDRPIAPHASAT